jgi:hypothetical protein
MNDIHLGTTIDLQGAGRKRAPGKFCWEVPRRAAAEAPDDHQAGQCEHAGMQQQHCLGVVPVIARGGKSRRW